MTPQITIYQNFVKAEHAAFLDAAFVPHDGTKNPFPHYYETYWISRLFEEGLYRQHDYCGLVSAKFNQKTRLAGSEFVEFILKNPGYDVYFVNPYPQLAYFFFNVWEHGEEHHPGLTDLTKRLLESAGYPPLLEDPGRNDHNTLLYCNYWVASKKFWQEYMTFLGPLFRLVQEDERRREFSPYLGLTSYKGTQKDTPYFPFIFERLFSLFLITREDVRACPYRPSISELERACASRIDWQIVKPFVPVVDALDKRLSPHNYREERDIFPAVRRLRTALLRQFGQMDTLLNSRLWRMTAPLRWGIARMRKILRSSRS